MKPNKGRISSNQQHTQAKENQRNSWTWISDDEYPNLATRRASILLPIVSLFLPPKHHSPPISPTREIVRRPAQRIPSYTSFNPRSMDKTKNPPPEKLIKDASNSAKSEGFTANPRGNEQRTNQDWSPPCILSFDAEKRDSIGEIQWKSVARSGFQRRQSEGMEGKTRSEKEFPLKLNLYLRISPLKYI